MNKNKFSQAFTLLEMLIVVSIIVILVGMGTVSYSTAQKKARDAKRKTDFKSLQNCMEQYYAENNGSYEVVTVAGGVIVAQCGSSNSLTISDPLNDGVTYVYTIASSTATDYEISATLEDSSTYTVKNLQ
ncbi:prepilin-type N-terminal cleavage/methylation domain-containing protein [Candidatus Roizmanbacteria bacterium]|nr:prepilin-type N-terminal cleavage/methylation domain-containing protein [Candidatus Roizmanbacteria bacterium]